VKTPRNFENKSNLKKNEKDFNNFGEKYAKCVRDVLYKKEKQPVS
jgi:hypothetical protein